MKFKLFGKTPMEKRVTALRQRVATLEQKRTAAQSALDDATAARQRFAVEGDLSDGATTDAAWSKLQKAVDSATSSVAGFTSALAEVSAQLGEAERALTADRETAARLAASEKIARDLAAIEPRIGEYLTAGRALATDLEKLGTLVFESGALANFLARACGEVELAAAVVVREVRAASDNVREGRTPIPPDQPQPVPVAEVVPPPPIVTVFMLRHSKYRDPATGALILLHRYQDAELSPRLAEAALRSKAATLVSDPIRRQNKNTWPRMNSAEYADDLDALDVDALPPIDAIEPPPVDAVDAEPPKPVDRPAVRHSKFEPLDRGPSFVIRAPRQVQP